MPLNLLVDEQYVTSSYTDNGLTFTDPHPIFDLRLRFVNDLTSNRLELTDCDELTTSYKVWQLNSDSFDDLTLHTFEYMKYLEGDGFRARETTYQYWGYYPAYSKM